MQEHQLAASCSQVFRRMQNRGTACCQEPCWSGSSHGESCCGVRPEQQYDDKNRWNVSFVLRFKNRWCQCSACMYVHLTADRMQSCWQSLVFACASSLRKSSCAGSSTHTHTHPHKSACASNKLATPAHLAHLTDMPQLQQTPARVPHAQHHTSHFAFE